MFYSGWAPLVRLSGWDTTVATAGSGLDGTTVDGDTVSAVASRMPRAVRLSGCGPHAAVGSSSSPSSPPVVQRYLGQGVRLLHFMAPSAHDGSGGRGGRGAPRAAEAFTAAHQRYHLKSAAPLPRQCGLVYLECQLIAVGEVVATSANDSGHVSGHGQRHSPPASSPVGHASAAAKPSVSQAPRRQPLVVGVCTAALPPHLLPGEDRDSIGLLTGSQTVYAHGHANTARLGLTLGPEPPLHADGSRRHTDEAHGGDSSTVCHRGLSAGDTVGCLVDLDEGTVRFTVNGQLFTAYVGRLPTSGTEPAAAAPPLPPSRVTDATRAGGSRGVGAPHPSTAQPPRRYFFAVGVTQRSPSLVLRTVMQVSLNAPSRFVLTVAPTAADRRGAESSGVSEAPRREPHQVNVVFPLAKYARELAAQSLCRRQQGDDKDNDSGGTAEVLPASTRPQMRGAAYALLAPRAGLDEVPACEGALSEAAVLTLVRRHFEARGMWRALTALEAEAKALTCSAPDTAVDATDASNTVDIPSSFAAHMAELRKQCLAGAYQRDADADLPNAVPPPTLLSRFLAHSPVSDSVLIRVQECARRVREPQIASEPAQTPSTSTPHAARGVTPRQLALYVLACQPDLFFLLTATPVVEAVLREVQWRVTFPADSCVTHMRLTPSDVWARFEADVLGPLHALSTVPDASAFNQPGLSQADEQAAFVRCVTRMSANRASAASPAGLEAVQCLLHAALTPSLHAHTGSAATGSMASANGLHISASTSMRIALGEALVALLHLLDTHSHTSSGPSRAAEPCSALQAAGCRLLTAVCAALRERVWLRLCHHVEAINERVLLVLTQWELALQDRLSARVGEEASGTGPMGGHREDLSHGQRGTPDEQDDDVRAYSDGALYDVEATHMSDSTQSSPTRDARGSREEANDDDKDDSESVPHRRHDEAEDEEAAQGTPHSESALSGRVSSHCSVHTCGRRHRHGRFSLPRDYFYTATCAGVAREEGRAHRQRRTTAARVWSALSLRRVWRRVHAVAALHPEEHATTSLFLTSWRRAERRLDDGPSPSHTEDTDRGGTLTGHNARFLAQLEAHLRAVYDLV